MAAPVFAGGHHHHNSNGIKVNQSIDQANLCSGPSAPPPPNIEAAQQQSPTGCLNDGSNNDIQRRLEHIRRIPLFFDDFPSL
jgi:hypothetical protein